MLLLGLSLGLTARGGGGGGVAPAAFSINADGWSATYASPPAFDPVGSPETFTVARAGFNAAGSPVSVNDTVTFMKRLREPYPNQATLTADQVALSDYVYASDTISGVANNSTRPAPKPIAMWVTRDLQHVKSNSLAARLAVVHAHGRNGRPVAAVKFIATDGINSVEQTVSAMSSRQWAASGLYGAYFECALDISTLTQGALCTLDAMIYPWVGAAFQLSVDADAYPSANLTTQRFLCDRTGAYGTAYAYVDGVGAGTPQVSTTAATAEANPYATVAAAAAAIQTFNNANFGRNSASGGIIRLKPGTHNRTTFSSVVVTEVPLVIEADTIANKASVIYSDNATSVTNGLPDKTVWRNMTFRRAGGANIIFFDANATLANLDYLCALENVHIDQNGQSAYDAWFYRLGRLWLEDVTGGWANIFNHFSTTTKHIHFVGSSGAWNATGAYAVFAARITNAKMQSWAAQTNGQATVGFHMGFSFLSSAVNGNALLSLDGSGDRGLGLAMTVFEQRSGLSAPALRISADNNLTPTENAVRVGLTVVGARTNELYQDTGSTTVAKSGYEVGCVYRGRNIKSDLFGTPNGARVGNWPAVFQAGCRRNAIIRGGQDNVTPGTAGAWVGEVIALGGQYGTDASPLSVAWTADASFDGTGAGNGDYRPGAGSVLGALPALDVHYPIDMQGQPLATDGTAVVGALQVT
ncbi:hypothetical protein OU426_17080 [Frigidibacter sp. RF13]|uniref:hypothetical protein n=1 Tax=Frigidibacter sp. RF13 TaxID=2997340 RepID=UPI00226FA17A|nr:hypothetical protein [Frigidibacter sp. RF13]MCY1128578.1 hypothetical protein [Frigidibacter sp. RF13]